MSNFKMKGVVTNVQDPVTGDSQKTGDWARRDFIVEQTGVEYPNTAKFTMYKVGENVKFALGSFPCKEGDEVEVEFNIKTNENKGNYFCNLNVWKVDVLNEANTSQSNQEFPADADDEEENLLPF